MTCNNILKLKLLAKFTAIFLSGIFILTTQTVSADAAKLESGFRLSAFIPNGRSAMSTTSWSGKITKAKDQSLDAVETKLKKQTPEKNTSNTVKVSPEVLTTKKQTATWALNIPKINLNNVDLSYGSVQNINLLDKQLLLSPVIDTLASEPCQADKSSYIMGHSEPANKLTGKFPAVRVFKDLNKLQPGDEIELSNKSGNNCKYTVTGSTVVKTGINGEISQEVFKSLYFPKTNGKSILNIQTCVKGTANQRLIVTATATF